jgi:hypothetical protein
MNGFSNDSAKVLREKLALTRELANLKPEVEHLRSQVASNQDLLAEKLTLQRQLSTLQVELENAKRTAERAFAKSGKTGEQHAQYEAQIEELQKELREAKQASKESSAEVESLKKELVAAKKVTKKVAAKDNAAEEAESKLKLQLEELRKQLATEKKERQQVEEAASKDNSINEANEKVKAQLEELRKELATEKKERQRAEKAIEKETAAGVAQRATLEDKLATFRAKLKSTKEKLREKEAELHKVEEATATTPTDITKATNPRKRPVAAMDPDAAIGTPGDAAPAKRGKRSFSTAPGDKSTFSITPFLNRTMGLVPEGPDSDTEEAEKETVPALESEAEGEATPTVVAKKISKKEKAPPKPKTKPLAPASSEKQNSKPKAKRSKAVVRTLEKVTEEEENAPPQKEIPSIENQEGSEEEPKAYKESSTTKKVPLTLNPKTSTSLKEKPRKSLMSFATFTDEPAPEKKKKRKLLGNSSSGLGKTLFDEDDGDKIPAKPVPGRGLFAARNLGKGGAFGAKKALNKPLVLQDEGFMFSPLKKDRKAMALAQSMIGD